ncbi:phospholipid carrier-dependent glycosyltransferase [Paenibacillus sp. TRM 82003]|uniref:ArnT family glycosyltransferase n=1 Tax=Kineococcus sp. TRM81007 TaxID=2925831 RepID=UPI001F57936D|nr:phospholipid carrier-dependent glycosyltransferase [Kineococcus sp. TRM81007]MCI2239729.1 phospholipid carrier-dependent glycosyltransferase [Kineococcus sp. TRM81007]MCI3926708.1 phospholipid carrier-dependent glycosyltransferase [Paenibacillus sp. TRM 82003]
MQLTERNARPAPEVTGAATFSRAAFWIAAGVAALGAALRLLHLGSAYDLFVDEVVYDRLGRSMAESTVPMLHGGPFFLHPPGFFVLDALWQGAFPHSDDVWTLTYRARALNALLGGLSVALAFLLVRRVGGLLAGAVAALLLLVEPFVLRQNGRVLLETATVFWLLLGLVLLVVLSDRFDRGLRGRGERLLAVAGGLTLGLAVCSKDVAVFFVVIPLGLAAWRRWVLDRRTLAVVLTSAAAPYLVYLGVVAANGLFETFFTQKFRGVLRLIGVEKSTGFNREGAPSLSGRLLDELAHFWTTYLLMGLGLVAAVVLLRSTDRLHKLLGAFGAATVGYLGYAFAFGTIEEHFAYYLVVPAALTTATAGAALAHRARDRRVRAVLLVALGAVVAWNAGVYVSIRAEVDNGYQRIDQWLAANAGGAPVGVFTETGVWGIEHHGAELLTSVEQAERNGIRYIVTVPLLTEQGYTSFTEEQVDQLENRGRVVFTFTGATNGEMRVVELPPAVR